MNTWLNIKRIAPLFYAWFLVACAEISGIAQARNDAPLDIPGPAPAVVDDAAPAISPAATESEPPAPSANAAIAGEASREVPAAELLPLALTAPAPQSTRSTNAGPGAAATATPGATAARYGDHNQPAVDMLCNQIGAKLGSVSVEDCLRNRFIFGGGYSVNKRPLVIKEYQPVDSSGEDFRVLIMGGIHGDEYSSISILFKWLALFSPQALEGEFHWRFAPLVNPDGLLEAPAVRQNANGVDLNRNFPSQDWNATAATYWQEGTGSNPRRFPGSSAASEPEVQWVVDQIEAFQPDVIVSVHAPYHLLDFDGPALAPDEIGELYLHQLGVYPGSLGNFAGLNRRIPVVTLELPSAGIMPPADQINLMWQDLVAWLDREGRKGLAN